MPDEEIDKLVIDAANQHHPPYDDTAWEKMEVLLDKHLPQKKDRRRLIVFILLFLLLGSAVFLGIEKMQKNNSGTTAAIKNTTENKPDVSGNPIAATSKTPNDNIPPSQQLNNTAGTTLTNDVAEIPTLQKSSLLTTSTEKEDKLYTGKKGAANQKSRTVLKIKNPATVDNDDAGAQTQKTAIEKIDVIGNTTTAAPEVKNPADDKSVTDGTGTTVLKNDSINTVKTEPAKTATDKNNAAATKKKEGKSFADRFAIAVSAGADVSFIQISNAGKFKPAYGAGFIYAIGKHLSISSGVYFADKAYTAAPNQYKITGYPNPSLKEIAAVCKVIEVPVMVRYGFKQVKNHNWLAGIGLSSLLMKKEDYDYYYQTPAGQTYSYQKTVNNENKHYFSVLTLSGGYQYILNNRFSFIAEPYIKVPLSGIGLGKVKLSSAGVLLTAAIKPFAKKKK